MDALNNLQTIGAGGAARLGITNGALDAALAGLPYQDGVAGRGAGGFNKMLATVGTGSNEDARKQAEEATAGLVSQALILPVLKQLRRSPWAEEGVFSGGIGEKTFGPQFDMQLADRIAHSPRLGIKNALADRIMKRGQPVKKAEPAKGLDVHG